MSLRNPPHNTIDSAASTLSLSDQKSLGRMLSLPAPAAAAHKESGVAGSGALPQQKFATWGGRNSNAKKEEAIQNWQQTLMPLALVPPPPSPRESSDACDKKCNCQTAGNSTRPRCVAGLTATSQHENENCYPESDRNRSFVSVVSVM